MKNLLKCWKNVEKSLKKCWKKFEKNWKNLEKSWNILKKMLKKFWKYVEMSYNIMSTSKSCTARQIRLKKLESDHQQCFRTSYKMLKNWKKKVENVEKMLKKCWILWKMRCLTKLEQWELRINICTVEQTKVGIPTYLHMILCSFFLSCLKFK